MSLREKIRVMVVDDMSTSRGLITQALDAFGVRNVATAENGMDAFRALSTAPVHLVISDYNMPEMDGFELIHELRHRVWFRLCRLHPAAFAKRLGPDPCAALQRYGRAGWQA